MRPCFCLNSDSSDWTDLWDSGVLIRQMGDAASSVVFLQAHPKNPLNLFSGIRVQTKNEFRQEPTLAKKKYPNPKHAGTLCRFLQIAVRTGHLPLLAVMNHQDDTKYSDITYAIIGAAMAVHRTLGSGFQEVIYQNALKIEFSNRNIEFAREFEMPIYYHGLEIGTRRVDFLVAGKIIVELKAITDLVPVHFAQGINYLEAGGFEVGLLINFGAKELQYNRLLNRKLSR